MSILLSYQILKEGIILIVIYAEKASLAKAIAVALKAENKTLSGNGLYSFVREGFVVSVILRYCLLTLFYTSRLSEIEDKSRFI